MPRRKGRCQVSVGKVKSGTKDIKCGMPLDADGKCPDHGKQK